MFHIARHERVGILFEDAQAGAGAEVDALAAIVRAGMARGVFDGPPAGGLVFRR